MDEIQKARWEILDFSDIDDLAGKLSDDDIGALLVSIKAKKKLKVLDIDCCHKIIGHGLWPIGGSTILERMNLPLPTTCKPLSIKTITHILESIIYASEDPSDRIALLKDITSKLMKCDDRRKAPIKDFLLKLNQLLINIVKCEICEEEGYEQGPEPIPCDITCFECFKSLCDGCNHLEIEECDNCGFTLCYECNYFAKCTGCGSNYCSNCAEEDDVDAAVTCGRDFCEQQTCFDCKPSYGCGNCMEIHTSNHILKLENKIEKLTDENQKVKKERDEVVDENEQLRKEVEELSSELGVSK